MSSENAGAHVLVVEDEANNRKALAGLLKLLKFEPIQAANLTEARVALAQTTPAIIILDLLLPDGDGLELLTEIRRENKPIKIAVVTGVTNQLKLHEVTAQRPDALFGKPIDLADFKAWLLEQRERLPAPAGDTPTVYIAPAVKTPPRKPQLN